MALSERQKKILAAVVELYVATDEPVGSKALCEALNFPVSSATVRNEMSLLSELGLLEQPHTSAGRVPSHRGYRYYVDSLMNTREVTRDEKRFLDASLLSCAYDPEKLLGGVARALASVTKCAVVSTTPSSPDAEIRGVQFVQTSRRTAMVLLMTSTGTLKTRVFHCDFDITPEILRIFFRVFNEKLAGMRVSDVTPAFIQSFAASSGDMAILMSSAFLAVLDVARDSSETEFCMDGQTNLLFYPELEGGARQLMDFFSRTDEMNRLLTQRVGAARVLIGEETNYAELRDSSAVVCRYLIGGKDAGAIAVIGPTRMNYASVVAQMEYLADTVGQMLTELLSDNTGS